MCSFPTAAVRSLTERPASGYPDRAGGRSASETDHARHTSVFNSTQRRRSSHLAYAEAQLPSSMALVEEGEVDLGSTGCLPAISVIGRGSGLGRATPDWRP